MAFEDYLDLANEGGDFSKSPNAGDPYGQGFVRVKRGAPTFQGGFKPSFGPSGGGLRGIPLDQYGRPVSGAGQYQPMDGLGGSGGQGGGGLLGQAAGLVSRDVAEQERIQRQTRAERAGAIRGLVGNAGTAQGRLDAATRGTEDGLQGLADELDGNGNVGAGNEMGRLRRSTDQYKQGLDRSKAGLNESDAQYRQASGLANASLGDVNAAYGKADEATEQARKNQEEFKFNSAQDEALLATGIAENAKMQKQQLAGMRGANGMPLTEQEKQQRMTQIDQQTRQETQSAVTQSFSMYRQNVATLGGKITEALQFASSARMQGAALKLDASKVKLGAGQGLAANAGARAEIEGRKFGAEQGLAESEQRSQQLQLEQKQFGLAYGQAKAGILSMLGNMRQMSALNALQLEQRAREVGLEFTFNNQEQAVSYFSGFSALFQMASQPGVRGMRRI